MNSPYDILGIKPGASRTSIRRAYRDRAKELHPDRNKAPDAHEQFIRLNEAYELLMNPPKLRRKMSHEEVIRMRRAAAREQAAHHARMRYEEFIKSDYYKAISSFDLIFNYITGALGLSALIFILAISIYHYGWWGLISSLLILLFLTPLLIKLIGNLPEASFKEFFGAWVELAKTDVFLVFAFAAVNIYSFFNITLDTLIPLSTSFILYLVPAAICFPIMHYLVRSTKFQTYFVSLLGMPAIINLFLAVNFLASTNPVKETYHFTLGYNASTLIILKDNQYDEYVGIRLFRDIEELGPHRTITFTFKDGLFGIRVMKDYQFDQGKVSTP